MIDTCQAASMYEKFYSPNILAVASSLVGEDSLSVCFYYTFSHLFRNVIQKYLIFSIMLIQPSVCTLLIDTHIMRWNSWRESSRTAKEQLENL